MNAELISMLLLDDNKAAQLFFNRLMESIPDHIYFKDREGRFLRINRAHALHLGLSSPSEAIGKTDYDFFEPSQARQKDADEREIIRTGIGFIEKEERASSIQGVERWVVTTKLPLFGDHGEIAGTFGISRNISEMKRAREALNAHHRLLSTLIEILPCRIFVKDREGRIRLTNQAWRNSVGIANEEDVVGRRLSDLVSDPRIQRHAQDDREIIEKGISILDREDFVSSPMGDKRWLLLSKVPLRDAWGKVDGIVGMAADITGLKETEARVLEAQEALREKSLQIESELEIARELQTVLMLSSLQSARAGLDPSAPFFPNIAFRYEPSAHLAGDFFHFVPISRHVFAFIMCDVMGHGVKAALVTTLVRGIVANIYHDGLMPSDALQIVNERLCTVLDRPPLPRFVTALYAIIDISSGAARMASAGHPWPLLQNAGATVSAVSKRESGPALGLIKGAIYNNIELTLKKGDRLLVFTDGWTEEAGAEGEEFGDERLAQALAGCQEGDPSSVLDQLTGTLRAHAQDQALSDDVCAILACF